MYVIDIYVFLWYFVFVLIYVIIFYCCYVFFMMFICVFVAFMSTFMCFMTHRHLCVFISYCYSVYSGLFGYTRRGVHRFTSIWKKTKNTARLVRYRHKITKRRQQRTKISAIITLINTDRHLCGAIFMLCDIYMIDFDVKWYISYIYYKTGHGVRVLIILIIGR